MISARTYRRITMATVVTLSAITISGAAVRLTGSGLGCSDWPQCEPGQFIAPLDEPHAMIEFVNRLVTGVVSLAIIAAVLGAIWRRPKRPDLVRWSLGLVVGMIGQIVLGGMVVLLELTPVSVIGHFLLSMVLLWNALVLHDRAGCADGPAVIAPPPVRRMANVLVAWALVVLTTGTVVTGSGPHSGDVAAERLGFSVPGVARLHGIAVVVFLVLAAATIVVAERVSATRRLRWWTKALVGAIAVQAAIGYTQYFLGVPALLVGFHIAGALAVWISTVQVRLATTIRPAEPRAGSTDHAVGATDRSDDRVDRTPEPVVTDRGEQPWPAPLR